MERSQGVARKIPSATVAAIYCISNSTERKNMNACGNDLSEIGGDSTLEAVHSL